MTDNLPPQENRVLARKRLLGVNPYILIEAKLTFEGPVKITLEAEGWDNDELIDTLREALSGVRAEVRRRRRLARIVARRRRRAAREGA